MEPKQLPFQIKREYRDVFRFLLDEHRFRGNSFKVTCQFQGVIPHGVREKIRKAEEIFGDRIFIIAEAGEFTFGEIPSLPIGDLLVVGYARSIDPKGLWLIADFDTTPVEEAMIFSLGNNHDLPKSSK